MRLADKDEPKADLLITMDPAAGSPAQVEIMRGRKT